SGGKPLYPSEFYATPYFIPRSLVHNEDVLHRRYRGSLWRGVAHGAIGFHFFLWSGDRGTYMDTSAKEGHFPENIMVTFTNHALLRTFDLRRFSQVSETFGRVLYEGRPVPRSAAILYSATTMINEPWWTGGESESYHVMEAFGWHGSLLDKGIQADYVTENDILAGRLSDYSVLVLPHCAFLPKDITQQMLKYLQAGGTVIASGAAGVWDEHGQPNRLLYKAIGRKEVFEPIATGPPAHPADVWIEGENYSQVSNMTIGGGRTYGGKFLQLASHLGPGGWAEYDFEVKAAGNYLLELAGKAWSHYTCAIKWAVDDGPLLAKIHRRGEPFAPNGTRWFVLGSTYLTAGKHRLRFQVDSSRPADNEWYAWFDAIALSRLPAGRPADVLADYLSGEVKPDGLVALADEMVGRGRLVLLGAKVATRRHLATRWELPGRSPANRIIVAHHRAEWGRWWQQLGLTLPDAPRSGDPDVEVSPWQWNGQTFLIVVNLSLDTPKQVEIQLPQRRQAVDVALAVPVRLRDGLLRTHLLPGAGRVYWLGTKP
ncbi:MAG: beta-galactosidase trimerization domain-containing protein, partial [Anaerolineales bacterium]